MTEDEMWKAVVACDKSYDGQFFYGVKSTGIFCRPSCASRTPLRQNVLFFRTPEEAMAAGFRPCKRCRPDLLFFEPALELVQRAKAIIDRAYADSASLAQEMKDLGITRSYLDELFKREYQESPRDYLRKLRLQKAKELLGAGIQISDTALAIGMNSLSGFYSFFKNETGMTPAEYRLQCQNNHRGGSPMYHAFYRSPIGLLSICATDEAVTGVERIQEEPQEEESGNQLTAACQKELQEYFEGKRMTFDLPLAPEGTPFQKKVWQAVREIPYGRTETYGEVARKVGSPKAYRAVGMSNHKNPILILIPCHRVIGSNGSLTGYAAGLENKQYLLELEQKHQEGPAC